MSTLVELQCFNKLLLQKMQRLEQQQRKEMDKIKESYNSLMDCARCSAAPIIKCHYCNRWYDADNGYEEGGGVELDEFQSNSTCACCNCLEDGTVETYECWDCEEVKKGKAFSVLQDTPRKGVCTDICKFCHFNRIYSDINFTQIQKYNKVIEELKKKFE